MILPSRCSRRQSKYQISLFTIVCGKDRLSLIVIISAWQKDFLCYSLIRSKYVILTSYLPRGQQIVPPSYRLLTAARLIFSSPEESIRTSLRVVKTSHNYLGLIFIIEIYGSLNGQSEKQSLFFDSLPFIGCISGTCSGSSPTLIRCCLLGTAAILEKMNQIREYKQFVLTH